MIDLTPDRLFAVLDEARKLRAQDRLAALVAVNLGFAGGDKCKQHGRRLAKQAGAKE